MILPHIDLPAKCLNISINEWNSVRHRVKIAVNTFLQAKRDVYIEITKHFNVFYMIIVEITASIEAKKRR
jgi:hypothetical protein